MNARLYDPRIGRFLSPDNYITDPENPQSYNRYSYALNNPLSYVDPTGNENYGLFGNGGYTEGYLAQRDYASYLYYQKGIDVFCGIRFNKLGQDEIDETLDVSFNSSAAEYYDYNKLTPEEKAAPVYKTAVVEVVANRWTKADELAYQRNKNKTGKYSRNFVEDSELIIKALFNYRYGFGKPMSVDASKLNWKGITQRDLIKDPKNANRYTLSFFDVANGSKRFTGTGIFLGKVGLIPLGGNYFYLLNDKYDFNIEPWSTGTKRNIANLALWAFNTFWVDFPAWSIGLAGYNGYRWLADKEFGLYGFEVQFYNRIIEIPK